MSNEMKKKMTRWRVFDFRVITEAKMGREKKIITASEDVSINRIKVEW